MAVKTKDKLVSKSIALMNRENGPYLSFREFAAGLKISPGHLAYHFSTKAGLLTLILEQVYKDFTAVLDEEKQDSFLTLHHVFNQGIHIQTTYVSVFSSLPYLKALSKPCDMTIEDMRSDTYNTFQNLLIKMNEEGFLKPFPYAGFQQRLLESVQLLFFGYVGGLHAPPSTPTSDSYVFQLWTLLIPHLSEMGLVRFSELYNQ